jgi:hypothetical protein
LCKKMCKDIRLYISFVIGMCPTWKDLPWRGWCRFGGEKGCLKWRRNVTARHCFFQDFPVAVQKIYNLFWISKKNPNNEAFYGLFVCL